MMLTESLSNHAQPNLECIGKADFFPCELAFFYRDVTCLWIRPIVHDTLVKTRCQTHCSFQQY